MRTLVDIRTVSDHFPGIGRYTYHLARALARRKDRESLVLLSNPLSMNTRFDIAALASEPDVRIVTTAARPLTISEQIRLPGELRKLSPQVIHFPYPIIPWAAPRPLVLTIHDVIPSRYPQYFTAPRRIMYRIAMFLALRRASCVICASEATRSDLISVSQADPRRLFVVHEGIGESFRPSSSSELKRVRAFYGLPERYLLYVGSNKPHKNLPALIDAYASLRPDPPLIMAGFEDPRYMQARRRVDFLDLKDRVRFVGPVAEKDLPAVYGGSLALIFPSLYEGFGLPPLEAMACGVPVACSDIPSLREVVGGAALLFDPKHSASIAVAIGRILHDENMRTDLQNLGFRRAAELSWDLAAEQTMNLYKRAAERRLTVRSEEE